MQEAYLENASDHEEGYQDGHAEVDHQDYLDDVVRDAVEDDSLEMHTGREDHHNGDDRQDYRQDAGYDGAIPGGLAKAAGVYQWLWHFGSFNSTSWKRDKTIQ